MRRRSRAARGWGGGWGEYPPYVSVGERRQRAAKEVAALQKKGKAVAPVVIEGNAIARTFWGKAWCQNLEHYSDYENRLPRGRSYVRSGAVVDLQIAQGKVTARVQGTRLYTVNIAIEPVAAARWKEIVRACSGGIDSVIELLQGKLSSAVMGVITRAETGLFPAPQQIQMSCTCPDWATLCKHVAATLYGVGARLDREPELLFRLRGVDPAELAGTAAAGAIAGKGRVAKEKVLGGDLASVFGIELEPAPAPVKAATRPRARSQAAAPPSRITGAELSEMGVPAATVQYWRKTGVLLRTETPGVYGRTPRVEERLQRRRSGRGA